MKKIYISGKISGEDSEQCRLKFRKAQVKFERQGFEVFNPYGDGIKRWLEDSWEFHIVSDLKFIIYEKPHMYFLNDWEFSTGAKIEHAVAKELDLLMFYQGAEVIKNDTTKTIIDLVSKKLNISISDIISKKRDKQIVHARHICCKLAKDKTLDSLQKIADELNYKQHGTVLNSIRVCKEALNDKRSNPELYEKLRMF